VTETTGIALLVSRAYSYDGESQAKIFLMVLKPRNCVKNLFVLWIALELTEIYLRINGL